jgi:hypothetical protein
VKILCLFSVLALAGLSRLQPAQVPLPSAASEANLVLETDFTNDEHLWHGFGDDTLISRVPVGDDKKEMALKFAYKLTKGKFSNVSFQPSEHDLAKARSFHFSVKAEQAMSVVVDITERSGGRFIATFYAPAGKWQPVKLGLSDFVLMQGKDLPKDENNRLDPEKIEMIAFSDLGINLVQGDEAVAKAFGVTPGARSLQIGRFQAKSDVLPSASFFTTTDTRLDTFEHPQVGWLLVGEAQAETVKGFPLQGSGMKVMYKQDAGKSIGLIRSIPRGVLVNRKSLTFRVASEQPATLLVQLAEADGGTFSYPVTIEGKKTGEALTDREVTVEFSQMKATADSKDSNNKLDIKRVHQIVFSEVAPPTSGTATPNALYIGGLRSTLK